MPSLRLSLLGLLAAALCSAQVPDGTGRLMATARLWVTVEYFHPYLAERNIDWDGALVRALPKLRAATSDPEFRTAISALLSELNDPETYVLPEAAPVPLATAAASRQASLLHSAAGCSFVITSGPAPLQRAVIQAAGLRAVIRLSEPASALPGYLAKPAAAANEPFPSVELRLLGAFKIWGAIHYFFAYKDLMDEDWDDVFASYLPKLIDARDATGYNLALADLFTHLTDTNTAPHSPALDSYFGEVPVGLRIRLLDKYPIVSQVLDPAASAAGVRPGDVVKRIGAESTTDRFRRFVQYVPASTAQRSGYDVVERLTRGPEGTDLELTIENAQGEAHVVKLTRQRHSSAAQRTTDAIRTLPGNIGYLDLERLTIDDAEKALAQLKDTAAIILDLRGPRAPAAALLASHLTSQTNVAAALVTTPLAVRPDIPTPGSATETSSTFLVKTLPSPASPLYKGKTVALIDERTIGEAEYAGLLLEAANKTEFVGEPTAGAESAIAEVEIPGGITITYSTEDIRHGNGGKLQRLGLQPNVPAPTTAKGLRAGKDEALEAAAAHLRQ